MTLPYTQAGKCAGTVWQRNRYGQISYPLFHPFNPRSEAQTVVRANFALSSKRWRTLTEKQRRFWDRAARKHQSRKRLGRSGPLCGYYYQMKVNVARANQGLAPLDLPPEYLQPRQPQAFRTVDAASFGRLPVGPTLFLQSRQLLAARQRPSAQIAAPVTPAAA